MFNKMFGGWGGSFLSSLAASIMTAVPDAPPIGRKTGWNGLHPRRLRPAGTPANYPVGARGDLVRARAIRRAQRWVASHPGAAPGAMPRHIAGNYQLCKGQG